MRGPFLLLVWWGIRFDRVFPRGGAIDRCVVMVLLLFTG